MLQYRVLNSVFPDMGALERLAERLEMSPGVESVLIARPSRAGAQRASDYGIGTEVTGDLAPGDLILAARGEEEDAAEAVRCLCAAAGTERSREEEYGFTGVETALSSQEQLDLAFVDVEPEWAERVCSRCIENGMSLLVSSALDEETETSLKRRALDNGCVMLGSGVGGAILSGVSYGYCPPVREGNIAIIGQSFTACLCAAFTLEWLGVGVRHLLPTGRRDCFPGQGGMNTRFCIREAGEDPAVDAIVLVLKSGDMSVLEEMVSLARGTGKKVYIYGLGQLKTGGFAGSTDGYSTLSSMCSAIAVDQGRRELVLMDDVEARTLALPARAGLAPTQRYLRGFLLSETVCGELILDLRDALGTIYSNKPVRPSDMLKDVRYLKENSIVDCGSPGVNPTSLPSFCRQAPRNRRMEAESYNKSVAVLLADWIGGVGCDRVSLEGLARSIRTCRQQAAADGRELAVAVIVYNCRGSALGTDDVVAVLQQAGAQVFQNTDDCALFVKCLLTGERT